MRVGVFAKTTKDHSGQQMQVLLGTLRAPASDAGPCVTPKPALRMRERKRNYAFMGPGVLTQPKLEFRILSYLSFTS